MQDVFLVPFPLFLHPEGCSRIQYPPMLGITALIWVKRFGVRCQQCIHSQRDSSSEKDWSTWMVWKDPAAKMVFVRGFIAEKRNQKKRKGGKKEHKINLTVSKYIRMSIMAENHQCWKIFFNGIFCHLLNRWAVINNNQGYICFEYKESINIFGSFYLPTKKEKKLTFCHRL